jgi:hypothetical protein
MVAAEEYGNWHDSARRIDLLCLDKSANLIVVELKRTEDGGHMELQALRYAAMVSPMKFEQLVEAHAAFRRSRGLDEARAQEEILEFLGWEEVIEEDFAKDVRIVLAAADFSKELTTSVLWLREYDLDIRCVRLKPYKLDQGRLLLDVQQVIPLPEASEYQTQIRAKEQAGRQNRAERHDIQYKFWSGLLDYARTRTDLHANRQPGHHHWIGGSTGKKGFSLNYVTREDDSQVELYIDYGRGGDEQNQKVFDALMEHQTAIEGVFGESLEWEPLPDRRSCRIRKIIAGGWGSPQEQWPEIHRRMVAAMVQLEKALRPFLDKL